MLGTFAVRYCAVAALAATGAEVIDGTLEDFADGLKRAAAGSRMVSSIWAFNHDFGKLVSPIAKTIDASLRRSDWRLMSQRSR